MDIIDDILRREGSTFTNDPVDRGGATKFGITQARWDDYVAKDPSRAPCRLVEALTEPWARAFYDAEYVAPFDWIENDELAKLVIDSAVQHGVVRVTRWLQLAVGVTPDGHIGPVTRGAVNGVCPSPYAQVLRTRLQFYADIVARDPTQAKFLRGWINRCCEFVR